MGSNKSLLDILPSQIQHDTYLFTCKLFPYNRCSSSELICAVILRCINEFSAWWSARGLVKLQRHPAYCVLFVRPLCYSWQKAAELFILSFWQKICLTVIFSALAAHGSKSKYITHLLFQNCLNLPNLSGVLHDSADTLKVVINCLRSNFWSWLHSAEWWQGTFFSLSNWNDIRTVHLPSETECFASSICAEAFLFIKAKRSQSSPHALSPFIAFKSLPTELDWCLGRYWP